MADGFAAAMARLGPFEPAPWVAAGVSGGADSLALALMARDWVRVRGGSLLGLVVDHGLRAGSADEARLTRDRLAAAGIPAEILGLQGLARGAGLAARARDARHGALAAACRSRGILHLLLGHHAADQAETLEMRRAAGSGADGLAGMAALRETEDCRILRPLLGVAPACLRALLRQAGIAWVEDPSNADPASLRARLRLLRDDPDGAGPAVRAGLDLAIRHGQDRVRSEGAAAAALASRARIAPGGFAVLSPGPMPAAAMGALLRMLGGRAHPPAGAALARLAADPRPATLGGVRLLPAGRLGGPGALLLVREARAMAPPVEAVPGAVWDGRFRLRRAVTGATSLGPVGEDAPRLRRRGLYPQAVLATLPALRRDATILHVPGLAGCDSVLCGADLLFAPVVPAACAPFLPAGVDGRNLLA